MLITPITNWSKEVSDFSVVTLNWLYGYSKLCMLRCRPRLFDSIFECLSNSRKASIYMLQLKPVPSKANRFCKFHTPFFQFRIK